MENLSKLTLVKRHLEKIKERSAKLSGFAVHLSGKYSLDSMVEKEKNNAPGHSKMTPSHS